MPGVVLVVGSYNQDQVWTCDELPAPGATRLGTYASGPGGKGFNQAVAAARVGAPTTFITALGEDAAADGAVAVQRAVGANGVGAEGGAQRGDGRAAGGGAGAGDGVGVHHARLQPPQQAGHGAFAAADAARQANAPNSGGVHGVKPSSRAGGQRP